MLAAYVIGLGLALGLALFDRRAFPFACAMLTAWAAIFFLERVGLGVLMIYADIVLAWAIILMTLKNPERRFITCAHLAVFKVVGVHLSFNALAYSQGGWWSEVGQALQFPYMWSVNAAFFAMALCLLWGRDFGTELRVLVEGFGRLYRSPPRRHHACCPAADQKVGP